MTPQVFEPARLGPVQLRNRIIKAATFEGLTPEGLVTDELMEYHRRVVAGGAGMTTLAYCTGSPEGRTHREQIVANEAALPGLRKFTDMVHAHGAAAAVQLGHAGPVANARSNGAAAVSASRGFNPLSMRITRAATTADLRRLRTEFVNGARVLVRAGFDSLELHLGHNYLLSAFLSPMLNRRHDEYGGSTAARARFPREVLRAVRDEVGDEVAVTAKLNTSDGVPGGLRLAESLEVARMLDADKTLDALQLTGGSSLLNPMYLFRGDAPVREFARTLPPWLRTPFRLFGSRFLPEYPFTEAYFAPAARQYVAELDTPVILLGGITRLDTMQQGLRDGFSFFAMARAILREPDLPNKLQADPGHTSLCVHCNKCMPTIYTGARCVLVQPG